MTTTKSVAFSRGDLITITKAEDANFLLDGRVRWVLADGWCWVEIFEVLAIPKKNTVLLNSY